MTLACKKCGLRKAPEKFFKNPKLRSGRYSECIACCYERMRVYRAKNRAAITATRRKWAKANPEKRSALNWKSRLKTSYGITPEEYDEILKAQGGRCALCRCEPAKGRRMCVDHCHRTGKNRAILCDSCNVGLGAFKDDPELLRRAASFIEAYLDIAGG